MNSKFIIIPSPYNTQFIITAYYNTHFFRVEPTQKKKLQMKDMQNLIIYICKNEINSVLNLSPLKE